ncbi:glycosyltransferase family 2 protein [Antarcticibacterium arcticum]|uniref:Glycosyltransferase family 2 protein n=1 Tax=Antarcticibacterium arcticum TaxID=2585771 RepID=A0A5B8YPF8_9FLAO|nr:glycosyltransferase family 2 protein [Antarcticibacterium arcticum]QED37769.1 glycosyltransferase family 2 protein [Antarcticibacterium arcticum]
MSGIWIVIVSYNGMQWLSECLESTRPYSVIIVDNNSTDGTQEYIKETHPEIILLEQKKNLGFGKANNIGISWALKQGADYVFLLNQDAYLQPITLKRLIRVHENNPNFGILSPIHLNGAGTLLDENFSKYYVSYDSNPRFYADYILNNNRKEIYEVPFINAAAWLISKQCLETVGGFDPMFYHYGEDENFCQRVHFFNFKVGVVTDVFFHHDRENRDKMKIKRGSDKYFENFEKIIKVRYGNINEKIDEKLKQEIRSKKIEYIKSFIKLNFTEAKYYNKKYLMLLKTSPILKMSRKFNKEPGLKYLDIGGKNL